jgi:hypothetical protein
MMVTTGVAIVYNRARRAKQGVSAKRGRCRGQHYFGLPEKPKTFRTRVGNSIRSTLRFHREMRTPSEL